MFCIWENSLNYKDTSVLDKKECFDHVDIDQKKARDYQQILANWMWPMCKENRHIQGICSKYTMLTKYKNYMTILNNLPKFNNRL